MADHYSNLNISASSLLCVICSVDNTDMTQMDYNTVLILFFSAVDQPCIDPQSTCCQELGGVAQVCCCSLQLVGG